MTNDLISRTQAIDAVEHITSSMSVCVNSDECHGMKRMQRQAVIELTNLTSAQPQRCEDCVNFSKTRLLIPQTETHEERTETHSCDCISRQAAIEAVYKNDRYTTIGQRLEALPSAQQERAMKDCRNCKHGNYNDHWDTYFCYYSGDCNDWDKWEPSVQPERKKGKWINVRHDNIAECDQCGITGRAWMNFCFDCGADMMEETK